MRFSSRECKISNQEKIDSANIDFFKMIITEINRVNKDIEFCEYKTLIMTLSQKADFSSDPGDDIINSWAFWAGWAQIAEQHKDWQASANRWLGACAKFPFSSLNWAHLAKSYLEISDFSAALDACIKSLTVDSRNFLAWDIIIEALIAKDNLLEATKLCTYAIKIFPSEPVLYIKNANILLSLKKYEEADRLCKEGIINCDFNISIYIKYAEIPINYNEPKLAYERWITFSKLYKDMPIGYIRSMSIALDIDDFDGMYQIFKIAHKCCHSFTYKLIECEKKRDKLLAWALDPSRIKHYSNTLTRLAFLESLFPNDQHIQIEVAKICLTIGDIERSLNILLYRTEIYKNKDSHIYILESLLRSYRIKQAENILNIIFYLYHDETEHINNLLYDLLFHGYYRLVYTLIHAHNLHQECNKTNARLMLNVWVGLKDSEIGNAILSDYVAFLESIDITVPLCNSSKFFLNIIAYAGRNNSKFRKLHNLYIYNILSKYDCTIVDSKHESKLCFYGNLTTLSYFSQILINIPKDKIVIVNTEDNSIDKNTMGAMSDYLLVPYSRLSDYTFVLSDVNGMPKVESNQTLIGVRHAVDSIGALLHPSIGAMILPFENSALFDSLEIFAEETHLLKQLNFSQKCEIIFTGPYHISRPSNMSKLELTDYLAMHYNIKLDKSKKILYFLQGELSNKEHIRFCMNKLASDYNIIYKPLCIINDIEKYNPAINIIKDQSLANNYIRYAADFIFADAWGGTCMSSLMLRLPVIPFYSRVVKDLNPTLTSHFPTSYKAWVSDCSLCKNSRFLSINPRNWIHSYLFTNGLTFDLLDVNRIKMILTDNNLEKMFDKHWETLETNGFGKFDLHNSPKRTADLIMKYVNTGTFGEDCSAILLKNYKT